MGDPPQQGHVLRRVVLAHPALVFPKGDVEGPVQRVFDTPMAAHAVTRAGTTSLWRMPKRFRPVPERLQGCVRRIRDVLGPDTAAGNQRERMDRIKAKPIYHGSFPAFRQNADEALKKLKEDAPDLAGSTRPGDDELIRLVNDFEMLLGEENRTEIREILERSVARVELTVATATVWYKAPAPPGSRLADQLQQVVALPEPLTA